MSSVTCRMFRGARFVAELAVDDAHHVVIHEESVDSLPKIVLDYAEIKMKGDTTPMRVLLVVDSSTRHLGATDVDQKCGSSGFAAKMDG